MTTLSRLIDCLVELKPEVNSHLTRLQNYNKKNNDKAREMDLLVQGYKHGISNIESIIKAVQVNNPNLEIEGEKIGLYIDVKYEAATEIYKFTEYLEHLIESIVYDTDFNFGLKALYTLLLEDLSD